eukprot:6687201-Pyramimonas_sp.AAC.1
MGANYGKHQTIGAGWPCALGSAEHRLVAPADGGRVARRAEAGTWTTTTPTAEAAGHPDEARSEGVQWLGVVRAVRQASRYTAHEEEALGVGLPAAA